MTTTIEETWRQGWFCLYPSGSLATKGDQAGLSAMGEGIAAARTGCGAIATYVNACRHRGHEIVRRDNVERRAVLRCGYHAWTYGLDGALRKAPGFESLADGEAAALALQPVRSAEWAGWVFVNISGTAAPLADWIAAHAPGAPVLPAGLRVTERRAQVVPSDAAALIDRFQGLLAGGAVTSPGPFLELAATVPGPGSGVVANLLAANLPEGPVTYRLDPGGPGLTRLTCECHTAEMP